jgi:hypothetical protein
MDRDIHKENPGVAAPGFCIPTISVSMIFSENRSSSADLAQGQAFPDHALKFRGLPTGRLQLSVFVEHRAAIAADAPAVGGERCTTTREVAPRHAGRAIAHPGGGRLARGKLGEINRIGGSSGKANQKASG